MKKETPVADMTIKELLGCRQSRWDEEVVCETLIIVPGGGSSRALHESGFRCMTFVATVGARPICKISGCSDLLFIEGIGGRGIKTGDPGPFPPAGWNIDCLPKSGLLQLWPRHGKIKTGSALSSFEVFSLPENKP